MSSFLPENKRKIIRIGRKGERDRWKIIILRKEKFSKTFLVHRLLDSRVERTSVFPSIPSFPCFHPDILRMAEGEKQRWAKGRVERHVVDVNAELFNRRRSVYLLRDDSQGTRIVPSSFPTRLFQLCDIVTLERSLRISYRYLYLSNVQELIWSSRCKHNHPIYNQIYNQNYRYRMIYSIQYICIY